MKQALPAAFLVLALLAGAGCGGADDPGPDAGADVPIVITQPDYAKDPGGVRDPGPGVDPGPAVDRGPGVDPGPVDEDPGPLPEDPGPLPEDPGTVADPGGPCVPSCAGKQCGGNGCGGTCGTCTGNTSCIANQCVCIPDCSGKTCGDDGCGTSCGSCGGQPCLSNGKCAALGCDKNRIISTNRSCVDNPTGASAQGDWWGNEGTLQLASYSAACTSEVWAGAEVVYRFSPTVTETVTFSFTGAANLRFFVLEDKGGQVCLGSTCIASTTGTVQVPVVSGRTYYLVVDSNEFPKQGSYEFTLTCPSAPAAP